MYKNVNHRRDQKEMRTPYQEQCRYLKKTMVPAVPGMVRLRHVSLPKLSLQQQLELHKTKLQFLGITVHQVSRVHAHTGTAHVQACHQIGLYS